MNLIEEHVFKSSFNLAGCIKENEFSLLNLVRKYIFL